MSATLVIPNLPKWKCHKEVIAGKISDISFDDDGAWLRFEGFPLTFSLRVDMNYVHKHHPHPGGYFVIYDDEYKSFSPAQAFERGYTRI